MEFFNPILEVVPVLSDVMNISGYSKEEQKEIINAFPEVVEDDVIE